MGNDMERDRLAFQHGHDSDQVRHYDQTLAERKQSTQFWDDYRDVHKQTSGTGGPAVSGDLGEALAKLFGAACVLLFLYAAWRFAVEAAGALKSVWGHFFQAVAQPFGAGHAFLVTCFVLSGLALWMVLRCFHRQANYLRLGDGACVRCMRRKESDADEIPRKRKFNIVGAPAGPNPRDENYARHDPIDAGLGFA
jgi:hypothetical protein